MPMTLRVSRKRVDRPARVPRCAAEVLESRTLLSEGGGLTNAGLRGDYFANAALSGAPAFTRNDVRVDFDWGLAAPGGSPDAPYNRVGADRFSVRWTGQVVPRYTEAYIFVVKADDGARLSVRRPGGAFQKLIDTFTTGSGLSTRIVPYRFTAGQTYDLKLEYRDITGPASVTLQWQSRSTPREAIEPLRQYSLGLSQVNDADVDEPFADVWKTIRGYDTPVGGTVPPALDGNGWPTGDFKSVLWDGGAVEGDQSGTYKLSFNGRADVTITSGWMGRTVFTGYNADTNTSTYDVNITSPANLIPTLNFANTRRTAAAATNTGVANIRLLRPGYTEANTFTTPLKRLAEKYPILRFMAWTETTNNRTVEWADRTLPGDNQIRKFGGQHAGVAWEYVVQFANETGRDLWLNFPGGASDDYLHKLALLLKYGSDAAGNPYASAQTRPVHPPLNPNLKIYVEYSNEVWNPHPSFFQYTQNLRAARAEVAAGNSPLNYDGATDEKVWARRRYAKRVVEAGNIFRSVFGDSAMISRVRPLLMWQFDNQSNTASDALEFLHNYYGNGDGQAHVADPHPVNYYVFGGGQASYYTAANSMATTVDDLFASGIPSPRYAERLKVSASWALSYGIKFMAYEGGVSMTDANGNGHESTAVQTAAREDPRMKDVDIRADRIFRELGGWADAYFGSGGKRESPWARTDNIDNLDKPQIRAIDEMNRTLPPTQTLGRPIAADGTTTVIPAGEFDVRSPGFVKPVVGGTVEFGKDPDPTSTKDRRGVAIYNLRADAAGTYTITLDAQSATPDSQLQLFVDNRAIGDVLSIPTSGETETRTFTLATGYHSLRLAWRSGFFVVNRFSIRRTDIAQ